MNYGSFSFSLAPVTLSEFFRSAATSLMIRGARDSRSVLIGDALPPSP